VPHAVRILAPAKVNLLLRVLGRRADGFHELETLFQAIGLYDELTLEVTDRPGVALEVEGADLGPVDENLAARAARLFMERVVPRGGVRIGLRKAIPAGAGLGGGSSDAAATLRGLEMLFGRALPQSERHDLAARLGSDVPFFLGPGGYALAGGRGERLQPLAPLPGAEVVLGLPPVTVATGPAYGLLASARAAGATAPPAPVLGREAPGDWNRVAEVAANDFEEVVCAAHSEVARALAAVRAGNPVLSMLSGSGGAVFAVHATHEAARAAIAQARRSAPASRFVVVPTLDRIPDPRPVGP
jgi:4-diphosphocytidyl-2-C-methyl-D-erythritol kinase